jgi:hypothetical protein
VPNDDSWLPVVVSHLLPESSQREWTTDASQHHDADAVASSQDDEQ